MSEWPVPAYMISLIADELTEQNVGLDGLFAGTTLTPNVFVDQSTVVPFSTMLKVIENAISFSPDTCLGLRVGMRERLGNWGILGYALSCCSNFQEAMVMGEKYHRVTASLGLPSFYQEDNLAYWKIEPPVPLDNLLPFVIEEELAGFFVTVKAMSNDKFVLQEAHFSYEQPSDVKFYKQLFDCKLCFNAKRNQLVFDASYLELKIPNANTLSKMIAVRMCEEFLAEYPTVDDLILRIRRKLLESQGHFYSEREIAAWLNIASRTLRYQLRAKGTSFQEILDDVRLGLAKKYLTKSPLSIEEIAERLNYSDARSFRRAFISWTTKTPSVFRLEQI